MNVRQFIWWWGPVLILCAVIFWLSSTPNLRVSDGPSDYVLRKTAHMVVYGVLFMAIYRALIKRAFSYWNIKLVIVAGLLAVTYAISDEAHQHFVETRLGLWSDVVFDAAGVCIALTGLAWWGWWNRVLSETNSDAARLQDG